jgi:hypothetical protein
MKLQQFSNFYDLKSAEDVVHPVNSAAFDEYKKLKDELRTKLTNKPEEKPTQKKTHCSVRPHST